MLDISSFYCQLFSLIWRLHLSKNFIPLSFLSFQVINLHFMNQIRHRQPQLLKNQVHHQNPPKPKTQNPANQNRVFLSLLSRGTATSYQEPATCALVSPDEQSDALKSQKVSDISTSANQPYSAVTRRHNRRRKTCCVSEPMRRHRAISAWIQRVRQDLSWPKAIPVSASLFQQHYSATASTFSWRLLISSGSFLFLISLVSRRFILPS